ncbi:MAG: hypothetical protein IPI44_11585 [Sulfuritalea sp.]|nr:hypothetical protein [Sulfuritalea sp.]
MRWTGRQIGIDRTAAAAYIDRYFARYPGVVRYMEETRAIARDKGYVETVFGRRLWLPEIKSSNAGRRQGAERAAINAPMQGTAADLIKRAMLAVQDWLSAPTGTRRTELTRRRSARCSATVPDDVRAVSREDPSGIVKALDSRVRRESSSI